MRSDRMEPFMLAGGKAGDLCHTPQIGGTPPLRWPFLAKLKCVLVGVGRMPPCGARCATRRRIGVNAMAKKSAKLAKKSAKRANAFKPCEAAAKSQPRKPAKPTLLSGGNPQITKADGDAPVQAYVAAMPGWKRDIGRRLDALIVRTVPGVRLKQSNGTRPSMALRVEAGSSASIASRNCTEMYSRD